MLALGDSISAGFGMEGKRGGLHEYRGKSWSIGGDANATTLPNFLRQFSPNVSGYSLGRREVRRDGNDDDEEEGARRGLV